MRRHSQNDINTPEQYDSLYFGQRTNELLAKRYLLNKLKDLNKGGRVLDIGCGLGRYFEAFDGMEIHGTELSTMAIAQCGLQYPDARVIQWFAGYPLPYDDGYFDLIWCGEFLEHIEEPQNAINDIIAKLKTGGSALFCTPIGEDSICPEHLWFFDRADIDKMFDDYNAEIKEVENGTRFNVLVTK